MNRKLLQITSMEFRELASKMINPTSSDADVNLNRFMSYIKNNEYISSKLDSYFHGVEYNFRECFQFENSGWATINPPNSEVKHVKAIYDYINYIIESKGKLQGHSFYYPIKSNKFIDKIRNLTSHFRTLVDIINGFIAKDLLLLDDRQKNVKIEQNIQNNYGTANVASGDIQSSNSYTINDMQEIANTLKTLINIIESDNSIPQSEKEDVVDDIELVVEQLESAKPKLSRVKNASKRFMTFLGLQTFNIPSIVEFLELHADKIDKLKELI